MTEKVKASDCRRWVIKIGSALLTNDGRGLDEAAVADWTEQMIDLRERGIEAGQGKRKDS